MSVARLRLAPMGETMCPPCAPFFRRVRGTSFPAPLPAHQPESGHELPRPHRDCRGRSRRACRRARVARRVLPRPRPAPQPGGRGARGTAGGDLSSPHSRDSLRERRDVRDAPAPGLRRAVEHDAGGEGRRRGPSSAVRGREAAGLRRRRLPSRAVSGMDSSRTQTSTERTSGCSPSSTAPVTRSRSRGR